MAGPTWGVTYGSGWRPEATGMDVASGAVRISMRMRVGYLDDRGMRADVTAVKNSIVMVDAIRAGHQEVARHVQHIRPGALICLHPTMISKVPDYPGGGMHYRFDRDLHVLAYPDACDRARSADPDAGQRRLYLSPWPCAFCFQRAARDYVTACDRCLGKWRVFSSAQLGLRHLGRQILPGRGWQARINVYDEEQAARNEMAEYHRSRDQGFW